MTSFARSLLLPGLISGLLLTACASEPNIDHATMASINKTINQPYYVNAATIAVDSKYNPLANAKDVSSTLPVSLDKAVQDYAQNRFRAAGPEGVFHIVVEDASVFLDHKGSSNQVGQWLNVDNQDRYTAVVKLNLFRDTSGTGIGAMGTTLRAERSVSMPDNVSLNERDIRLKEFTTEILGDLDKAATDSIMNALKLSAPEQDLAPSPGPYPPIPVDKAPIR